MSKFPLQIVDVAHSNVNVDDIPIGQWPIIRNTMTCNVIHRGAYRFREHRISQWWWVCIWFYCFLMDKFIDFLCRQPWLPIWSKKKKKHQLYQQNAKRQIKYIRKIGFTLRIVEHFSRILAANLQLLRIASTELAILISGFGDLNMSGSSATKKYSGLFMWSGT